MIVNEAVSQKATFHGEFLRKQIGDDFSETVKMAFNTCSGSLKSCLKGRFLGVKLRRLTLALGGKKKRFLCSVIKNKN